MAEVVVAGLLTSPVVNMVGDKLKSAIEEQACLWWNFTEDIDKMKQTMESIAAMLKDAEKQSLKKESARLWLKRLKHAALNISDVMDDYQDIETLTSNCFFLDCVPEMFSFVTTECKKMALANEMKNMRETLRNINEQGRILNFTQSSASLEQQQYDQRETTSAVNEAKIFGRDGEKKEIIEIFSGGQRKDGAIVYPIYGLGGMGKSTLAQLVYNDTHIKQYYDQQVWVYVSQEFDLKKIGRSIISQLSKPGAQHNADTLQLIQQCLNNVLHGKKVLIVLDDIWEQDALELDKLKQMLHMNKKGSMVDAIVTTRFDNIANKICTDKLHKIKTLSKYVCWDIIKTYSGFEKKNNKIELEKIGLDIAEKCGGLPLAAQAIGYMLKTEDLAGWSEMNKNDIWNKKFASGVYPSLMLSYVWMQPILRLCFSYCAIFPKGHEIYEDDLIYQWLALDFITKPSEGKKYIKELLGMSFLQNTRFPNFFQSHMTRYTMHDLVHDLARSVIGDELIVIDASMENCNNTSDHKYCRFALLTNYDGHTKLSNILPKKVRALHFSSRSILAPYNGSFSFAKCLRILDFSQCPGITLPSCVGQLNRLRYLIAPNVQNERLPESIVELSKLQYLNLRESPQMSSLLESTDKLTSLMYLCLSRCRGIVRVPQSLRRLKNLVHLDMSGCSKITVFPELFGGLQSSPYVESLGGLSQLQHLDLSWCPSITLSEAIGSLVNLQYFYLSCCENLESLPNATGNLVNLQFLCLSFCKNLKSLPDRISEITTLKSLSMTGCSDELTDQACSKLHYSLTLPHFKVQADDISGRSNLILLENLNDWKLIILSLQNVRLLEEASTVKLSDKSNLSSLTLAWTLHSDRLLDDKDVLEQLVPPRGLKHLDLKGYSSRSFPSWLMGISYHLPNLITVTLDGLPTCSELMPALGQLQNLVSLSLESCYSVTKIDMDTFGGKRAFPKLSHFNLIDMKGLEEWSTTYSVLDGEREHFMFPMLTFLGISNCPKLRLKPRLPTCDMCSIEMSDQVISSLEEVGNNSTGHFASSVPCTTLSISGSNSKSLRVFHHFPALKKLHIKNCAYLTSLPESMRHLASLERLTLYQCNSISALPEWMGDLASLKTLNIMGNPDLKRWCEAEDNKTKLAHTDNIEFDDCD